MIYLKPFRLLYYAFECSFHLILKHRREWWTQWWTISVQWFCNFSHRFLRAMKESAYVRKIMTKIHYFILCSTTSYWFLWVNIGDTFILFNKQMKGNKRELIQFGVPIFGHIKEEQAGNNQTSMTLHLYFGGCYLILNT